jgi:hypothetical protein
MIPAAPKPDCPDCARTAHGPGPIYDMGCRACAGRYLRSLPRHRRQSWYQKAASAHGRDEVSRLIEEHINVRREQAA